MFLDRKAFSIPPEVLCRALGRRRLRVVRRGFQGILTLLIFLLPGLAFLVQGCSDEETLLSWQDLTPQEQTFIRRIVVLERAKAVAHIDRDLGDALLDSLSLAWGDSAKVAVRAMVPKDPARSRLVHDFLFRTLTAEKDSLLTAARPDRLGAPIIDPPPPVAKDESSP